MTKIWEQGVHRDMTLEEIAEWEEQQATSSVKPPEQNIIEAPEDLFGGPTLKDIFDGN